MDQVTDQFRSSTWGWLRGTLAGWLTLLLCLVGVGLVIILVKWLNNIAITYEITPDRLIIRRGIVNKSIDEIELYRVKNIRIDFSLINQWADIGTISILSSDETTRDAPLVIPHRLMLAPEALLEGVTEQTITQQLLDRTPVPR